MKARNALRFLILVVQALGCGSTSGDVLARIEDIEPPGSNLRMDVFLVRDVASCAVGEACRSSDPENCFYVTNAAGVRLTFRPESLAFVPPGDPSIAQAEQSACFRIGVDDTSRGSIERAFDELKRLTFQLSEGEINLDLRFYNVGPIDAGFKRWENGTGIFLQPTALESVALPLMNRETDYSFSVTGITPIGASPLPKVDFCAGTNWQEQGGLGGTAYTWLSAPCAEATLLLRHFMAQSYFARRDAQYIEDIYAREIYEHDYPPCGRGDPNPTRWFPADGDCATDPDWSSCGNLACRTNDREMAFQAHILTVHWEKGRELVGNHCRNGRADYDETSVDTGGVCDRLGR